MFKRFMQGALLGVGASLLIFGAVLLFLQSVGAITMDYSNMPKLGGWFAWVYDNLNYSVYLFIALLGWFIYQLMLLNQNLNDNAPLLIVQVREQRIDLNIALVFGVGVIFTALGMRSALIYALGGGADIIEQSAGDLLGRLVNGGILVALSTTIVGGVGGYLMRLAKLMLLGRKISFYYQGQQQEQWRQLAQYLADEINPKRLNHE